MSGMRNLRGYLWELNDRISRAEKRPFDDRPGGGTVLFHENAIKLKNTGSQTLRLDHLPVENSEHLYWNTVYQPATEWSRSGKVITVSNADGRMLVGDWLRAEYAYSPALPAPVTPQLSAASGFDLPRDTLMTSLSLPGATQLGDLVMVTAMSGFGGSAVVEIPDDRMTRVAHSSVSGSTGGRLWGTWVGYADSLSPLNVQMQAQFHATGQFAKGSVLALRALDGPLEWDPARVAVGPAYANATGNMPAVPGTGSGAFACVVGAHSGQVGGNWTSPAMDPYTLSTVNNDSGTTTMLGWTGEREVGPTLGPPNTVATWRGVVVGFK